MIPTPCYKISLHIIICIKTRYEIWSLVLRFLFLVYVFLYHRSFRNIIYDITRGQSGDLFRLSIRSGYTTGTGHNPQHLEMSNWDKKTKPRTIIWEKNQRLRFQ